MTQNQKSQPKKGELNGECNRTACTNPGANWKHVNGPYYCQSCAFKIMSYPENKGLLTKT